MDEPGSARTSPLTNGPIRPASTGPATDVASTSASHAYAPIASSPEHVTTYGCDDSRLESAPTSPDTVSKPKRHRNKPSLSCRICTLKKTKCDRIRPICFACQKRRTICEYSTVADLIEQSHNSPGGESPRKKAKTLDEDATTATMMTATPKLPPPRVTTSPVPTRHPESRISAVELESRYLTDRTPSRSSTGSSPSLLSNVPFSHPTVSNVFKAQHPFSNYWTHQGGLAEVVGVLPSKDQADIIVAKYFDAVDPIYPLINQPAFTREYELFWSLSPAERDHFEGSLIALLFVMLALGTQFIALPCPDQKEQTAEFYVSASHQALRLINYLGRPSIRSMQCMVLIIYFLMNDNHASDAYSFAGIVIRQAYALGLNRDPSITASKASPFEKQQRRKLWQAVLFQDTFFCIILKLPPTATHSDCRVADLATDPEHAPTVDGASDTSYTSSNWYLANLVQHAICTPRALDLPISRSEIERARLISEFSRYYESFPKPFRSPDEASICDLASKSRRHARQALFITSNYYHCMMLVQADEHESLSLNAHGILDAAHTAISSFFLLHKLFEDEARVWYHFQHRAFSEALVIAELISRQKQLDCDGNGDEVGHTSHNGNGHGAGKLGPTSHCILRAKDDVIRMIGILGIIGEHDAVARTRASVLSKYV